MDPISSTKVQPNQNPFNKPPVTPPSKGPETQPLFGKPSEKNEAVNSQASAGLNFKDMEAKLKAGAQ